MVRSAKKEQDKNQNSSLGLLYLPNEILEMIFSYLSSKDILQSFFEIDSDRIQSFLSKHFAHFDFLPVIYDKEQWIKRYFNNESHLCHWIVSFRLTDQQIKLFVKYKIEFSQLTTLDIVDIGDNTLFRNDLLKIAPLLNSLSLDYLSDDMSHDDLGCLARILFNNKGTWQQQVEKLCIKNIYLPFGFHSLQLMNKLRHLTIPIRYEYQLFDLCSILPSLQSCYIDVLRPVSASSDRSMNISNRPTILQELKISGNFSSHSILYQFILLYQSSLNKLILSNIHHPDIVNGEQMKYELIQQLTPRIDFSFHFQFPFTNSDEFDQETYIKTFDWTSIIISFQLDDEQTIVNVSSIPTTNKFN
ncbi:hypothetical protein I4U23_012190 [Adineta vaga]|nr:hypothetical protein I4U23_012190 [Adineta vaga]